MRIAIARLAQEVNGFSPILTTLENFNAMGIYYGNEIIEKFSNVEEIGGFIQAAHREKGVQLVPTMSAGAVPSGKIERQSHRILKAGMIEELRKAGSLDGIYICLHGAMTAEGEDEVEADLLESIRKEWGNRIPIVISLDHHANVTKKLVESVTALLGYKSEPHIDVNETGEKAARILIATIKGNIQPTMGWRKIPLIAMGNILAPEGPLGEFFDKTIRLEQEDQVLSVSIFPGFPFGNYPELGWATVAVTDNAPGLAQEIADQLAMDIWKKRSAFIDMEMSPPAEAVARAIEIQGGPVILADTADATGAGAPGDSTAILKALLGRKIQGKAMLTIVDPDAAKKAIAAGVDANIVVDVGAKYDRIHYQPICVSGRVIAITDGKYVIGGPVWTGITQDMQGTAVLEVGDIYIVVSEAPGINWEPSIYRSVGLEPKDAKIVVVKSSYSFRAAYESIAKEIILVDTPGVAPSNLRSLAPLYRDIPRPMYPLEEDATFIL